MRRMYSKEQLQKLIDEVSRLIAIEELDKVVPVPATADANKFIQVNATGTGYQLTTAEALSIDGKTVRPANVYATGDITANSIIENMSGYSLIKIASTETVTYNYVYGGIVKNGNKLTLVLALKLTKTGSQNSIVLGNFNIPSSVGSKLYTTLVGQYNFLANSKLTVFESYVSSQDVYAYVEKLSNTNLQLVITQTEGLTTNTEYYIRYEVTFLLSENLAA